MSADSAIFTALPAGRALTRTRSRFYLGMTLTLCAIVLVGFTPTLFGRAAFQVPKMPGYLYLHGLVTAAWFALMAVQASLVGRSLALHRQLGWAAIGFAVLIPVIGMGTQLAIPDRVAAAGIDVTPFRPLIENVFWLNLFAVTQFTGFVIAAISLRRRGESHKRLMLFAGISIIMPAAARFARWPIFGNQAADLSLPASTGREVVFALSTLLLLVGAVAVHDLVKTRRLHRVTWAGAIVMVGTVLLTPVFVYSDWGKAIVWAVS